MTISGYQFKLVQQNIYNVVDWQHVWNEEQLRGKHKNWVLKTFVLQKLNNIIV